MSIVFETITLNGSTGVVYRGAVILCIVPTGFFIFTQLPELVYHTVYVFVLVKHTLKCSARPLLIV